MSNLGNSEQDLCLHDILAVIYSNTERTDKKSIYDEFLKGQYERVVSSHECATIFKHHGPQCEVLLTESLMIKLRERAECFISKKCHNYIEKTEFMSFGIASLNGFIQSNWTGPTFSNDVISILWLPTLYPYETTEKEMCDHFNRDLLLDGESTFLMKHQELLLLARVILDLSVEKFPNLQIGKLWLLRCLLVHQHILEEHSQQLHDRMVSLIEGLMKCNKLLKCRDNRIEIHLDAARVHLYYGEVTRAKEHVRLATEAAGMTVELVGVLGKRTRHQQNDISQLALHVSVARDAPLPPLDSAIGSALPRDYALDDDVRLDRVALTAQAEDLVPPLRPLEQAVLMSAFVLAQRSQPRDKLADEQLMPYLDVILSQPCSWSVHVSALYARCHMESGHRRTVERALRQAQALADSSDASDAPPAVKQRLELALASHLPHRWRAQAQLAALYVALGAVNTALDIYIKLEHWEEVITCYNLLQLRHKAAEVIQQELDKRPSVKLWCMLGDATDDAQCYEKAWELSGRRSARAQRHWGFYYFSRSQYAASIAHLQQSVSLNSIQPDVWFKLGFAALDQEDWKLCAQAYRRYCEIDTDSFEAWNNLAKAYVKLGEKARAWKTLQEAVRCNYESWQVWDNLLAVSTDCGEFEEVIRAYHRLLELKEKHIDEEVLQILVKAVANNLEDNRGMSASRLKKSALALFGRLTGQVTTNAKLWQLYAQLVASVEEQTPETLERTAQYLQRAHRAAVQSPRWHSEQESCVQVMQLCSSLANAYLECCKKCMEDKKYQQGLKLLSSAKLSLQGVIVKVKKEYVELSQDSPNETVVTALQKLEQSFDQILTKIDEIGQCSHIGEVTQ